MIAAIRSEFRKLLTVRSTLFMVLIAFLLTSGLIGFWIYGYKDVDKAGVNDRALLDCIFNAVSISGLLFSIITILSVGHEYRYSTIMYSLTSINRRSKVFFAKLSVVALFSLVAVAVLVALNVIAFYIGLRAHHISYAAQHLPMAELIWRAAASVVGSVAFAFIITVLLRSLIGAIVIFLIVPSTIEGLLQLLLKDNVKYLPFTSLGNLTSSGTHIKPLFSLAVVGAYVAFFGLVSYIVFLKRDAN